MTINGEVKVKEKVSRPDKSGEHTGYAVAYAPDDHQESYPYGYDSDISIGARLVTGAYFVGHAIEKMIASAREKE